MTIIRCTLKLLKELDIRESTIYDFIQPDNFIGSWYANIIRTDGRKCLLFVNDKTLFTFMIPAIKKAHLVKFRKTFIDNLRLNLSFLGVHEKAINKICDIGDEIIISKTISKSVLGSMNDYARLYKSKIKSVNGELIDDIVKINLEMNTTPMGALGYSNGGRALLSLLEKDTI